MDDHQTSIHCLFTHNLRSLDVHWFMSSRWHFKQTHVNVVKKKKNQVIFEAVRRAAVRGERPPCMQTSISQPVIHRPLLDDAVQLWRGFSHDAEERTERTERTERGRWHFSSGQLRRRGSGLTGGRVRPPVRLSGVCRCLPPLPWLTADSGETEMNVSAPTLQSAGDFNSTPRGKNADVAVC